MGENLPEVSVLVWKMSLAGGVEVDDLSCPIHVGERVYWDAYGIDTTEHL